MYKHVSKKIRLNSLRTISTLLFLTLTMILNAQNYNLKSYSETLPQTYIYNITQSNDGFLWLGTEDGIIQYDGIEFKYKFKNNIDSKNFITTSFKNGETTWLGHFQGTITKIVRDSLFVIYEPERKSIITHIEKSQNGEIWASTFTNGFVIIDSLNNKISHLKFGQISFIKDFKLIEEDKLLVGTQEGLCFFEKNKNGQWESEQKIEELADYEISRIIKLNNSDKFLVATLSNGLYTIHFNDNQPFVEQINLKNQTSFIQVQDVLEDKQNNLWISTFGNGLYKLSFSNSDNEYNTIQKIRDNEISNFDNIKTIFEDKEGNIWCGSYGSGLFRIVKQPFTPIIFEDLENGGNITAVLCDDKETIWAGTAGKIIKYQELSGHKTINLPHHLANDIVTTLYYQNDTLWIGTEKNGIYLLDVNNFSMNKYHISNGSLENSITSIKGRGNIVWISTQKGICKIDKQSNIHNWFTIEKGGLPHNLINDIFLDSRERLWISTPTNTLTYIDSLDKLTKIPIYSNNKIFTIGTITEDSDSTIWIATNGAGIFKVEQDSIANLTKEEGLFSNYCNAIAADNDRNIWVTHTGGVSKVKTLDFTINPIHKLANIKSNYNFNKNAIKNSPKNKILMGSTNGLWIYNPNDDFPDNISPILSIKSIKIGNKTFSQNDEIFLKHGKYDITINYIGIFLENPESIWYKHELENVDLQPNFTQKTSVTYKNISDGQYIFNIEASINGDFDETTQQSVVITINKPFWKSPIFITILASLLLSISLHFIIKREQKHKIEKESLTSEMIVTKKEIDKQNLLLNEKQQLIVKQNEELRNYKTYLEKIVEERTKALIVAKNRAEESDRLKTAFLNNISHEIRTPLHAICGFSKFLSDESFNTDEKDVFISTINQNAEDLMQMVDEIIDMSVIDSQTSLLSQEPFELHDLLLEVEEYYNTKDNQYVKIIYSKNKSNNKRAIIPFDRARVRHLFLHLINNSLKFTEQGNITFGYKVEGEAALCFVEDTGIGISKEEIKNVFKPFHKITSHTNKLYRGAGIGLAIVDKLVKLMQGQIWFESEINKGTSVYFRIPLYPTIHIDESEV